MKTGWGCCMAGRVATVTVFVVLWALTGTAQVATFGSISGTVTDGSGAMVPRANVTVTNQATGIGRKVITSDAGFYTTEALAAGDYTVEVASEGFKQNVIKDVHVDPGQRRGVDVSLSVGNVNEHLTVEADMVGAQTETSESGGTITAKEVSNLMLNGRNFQTLATIVPGVSSVSGSSQMSGGGYLGQTSLIVNGASIEQTTYTIDGVYNMVTGSLININVLPVIDSIAEFRVLKDNYSARYGLAGSGQVIVDTKSGTTSFHGTGYDYVRNNDIGTAHNYFNRTALAPLHQNIFGFSLGGPVILPGLYNTHREKKTYFFAADEWRINHSAAVIHRNMIGQAMRNGDFSALFNATTNKNLQLDASSKALLQSEGINPASCLGSSGGFVNQINPACFNPTAVALMNAYWPLPNNPAGGAFDYLNNGIEKDSQIDHVYRVDHSFNDKHLLTVRVNYEETNARRPSRNFNDPAPNPGASVFTPALNGMVRWNANFTPTLINTASIGETYSKYRLLPTGQFTMPTGATITGAFPGADPLNRIPNITMLTGGWSWLGVGAFPSLASDGDTIVSDDMISVKHNHVLQFGGLVMFGVKNANVNAFPMGLINFSGSHTGDSASDFLLGLVNTYTQSSTQRSGNFHYRWTESYFQDDWKATPKLALNLGVRWAYYAPETVTGNQITNFKASTFNPANAPVVQLNGTLLTNSSGQPLTSGGTIASLVNGLVVAGQNGTPVGFYTAKKNYFGPRIGFAYQLTGDGKTSIHGGYGLGYTPAGLETNPNLLGNPPYTQSTTVSNGLLNRPTAGVAAAAGLVSLSAFGADYRATTIQTWSLTLERELFPHAMINVAYAGSSSQHVFSNQYDANFPLTGTSAGSAACAASANNPQPGKTSGFQFDPCINTATVNSAFYRPYSGYSGITSTFSGGKANYNSLQSGLVYRTGNMQLNLGYTWSKTLTNIVPANPGSNGGAAVGYGSAATFQDPHNVLAEYGRPDYDRTHVFTGAWVIELPFFKHSTMALARGLLSGWNFSGLAVLESGFALTPGLAVARTGLAIRPDQVAPVHVTGNPVAWFNTNAFAQPAFGFFGSARNGTIQGPGEVAFNVAVGKTIPFTERLRGQVRVEAFNVANHPNFLGINTQLGSTTFGQAITAADPRIMEAMFRLSF